VGGPGSKATATVPLSELTRHLASVLSTPTGTAPAPTAAINTTLASGLVAALGGSSDSATQLAGGSATGLLLLGAAAPVLPGLCAHHQLGGPSGGAQGYRALGSMGSDAAGWMGSGGAGQWMLGLLESQEMEHRGNVTQAHPHPPPPPPPPPPRLSPAACRLPPRQPSPPHHLPVTATTLRRAHGCTLHTA
jgi:hypothetical protein